MADERVQLNEEALEEVAGGKFSFFTASDGTDRCYVTGHGVFTTTANGFFQYITLRNANPGLTEDEYFAMATAQKIIW